MESAVLLDHVATFPTATLPASGDGLPVEVSLIAQLGHGAGDALYSSTLARQQAHLAYANALDEPSARLAAPDFSRGETSALFSFSVGPKGHPFHRHAGHRVFTAISGSGGARLRFSTVSDDALALEPQAFFRHLHHIEIPPDCVFTVRFGGGTWHQFAPLKSDASHPVLFALSCHTNEAGGALDDSTLARVQAGSASIATLTELPPAQVAALLDGADQHPASVTRLALDSPAGSIKAQLCERARSLAGRMRQLLTGQRQPSGYVQHATKPLVVQSIAAPRPDALLLEQLPGQTLHHQDMFELSIDRGDLPQSSASTLLTALLTAFVDHPPSGVSGLMRLRNVLVRPLGLRTATLGCPVSSLASAQGPQHFAGRFPVLGQRLQDQDRHAQVALGADDRHLCFRSCAAVRIEDQTVVFSLGTRVHCNNAFGRFYMTAIDRVHRRYVGPTMLRTAVAQVLQQHQAHAQQACVQPQRSRAAVDERTPMTVVPHAQQPSAAPVRA